MSQRTDQVAEEIKKSVSQILLKEIHDPRMGFVTITRVAVTRDLKQAKIFYSVLGDDAQKKSTEQVFLEYRRELRRMVAKQVQTKFAIVLQFVFDKSIEDSFRINEILKQIKGKEEKG